MKWYTILGLFIFVFAFIIVGIVGGVKSNFKRSYDAQIAAIRAKGEPVTIAELVGKKVPDAENGAIVYKQIFNKLASPAYSQDSAVIDYGKKLDTATPEQWNDAREIVRRHKDITLLLDEAVSKPKCQFFTDWSPTPRFDHYAKLRELERYAWFSASVNAHFGDMPATVHSLDLGFKVSNSLDDDPTLIGQLVRIACYAIASRSMKMALKNNPINEQQAKQLFDTQSKVTMVGSWRKSLIGERAIGVSEMVELEKHPTSFRDLSWGRSSGSFSFDDLKTEMKDYACSNLAQKGDSAEYLKHMARQIEGADLSYIEANRRGYLHDDPKFPFYAVYANMLSPVYGKGRMKYYICSCQVAGDQVYLALLAYKARFGAYPSSMNELKTKLGWKLPKDTFSDNDFLYKRKGKGFVLYSVGPNMKDDGGVQRNIKYFDAQETGDFVWAMDR